jgi:hypothetical protein
MKTTSRLFIAIALPMLLQGCASLDGAQWRRVYEQTCHLDEQWLVRDTLYFGRSISTDGVISLVDDDEWQRFENETLGIAFPTGHTVIDAHGAWRNADGVQRGEPSKVVVVVHPDDQASEAAITHVIATYKQTFRQESVLREHAGVCVRP